MTALNLKDLFLTRFDFDNHQDLLRMREASGGGGAERFELRIGLIRLLNMLDVCCRLLGLGFPPSISFRIHRENAHTDGR